MTTVIFDDLEVSGDLPESELMTIAVNNRLEQLFYVGYPTRQWADIEVVRLWALTFVREQANKTEAEFDDRITSSPTKAIFLNTEIVEYYAQGRPTNPNPNVFVVANAMAIRRGITLHDMLEILFLKWRNIQSRIAGIVTELDRLIEAIEAAVTIDEIQAILESINF